MLSKISGCWKYSVLVCLSLEDWDAKNPGASDFSLRPNERLDPKNDGLTFGLFWNFSASTIRGVSWVP